MEKGKGQMTNILLGAINNRVYIFQKAEMLAI